MLRLSKLTDYAVVVLARLARDGDAAPSGPVQNALSLAGETGIAEPTVAKVLKLLAQAGLVEGVRGPRGGYRLTRPLASMPLSDIIVAINGPIALTACVDGGTGMCEAEGICPVRGRWDPVNDAIRRALSGITLADLAPPPRRRAAPPSAALHALAE